MKFELQHAVLFIYGQVLQLVPNSIFYEALILFRWSEIQTRLNQIQMAYQFYSSIFYE